MVFPVLTPPTPRPKTHCSGLPRSRLGIKVTRHRLSQILAQNSFRIHSCFSCHTCCTHGKVSGTREQVGNNSKACDPNAEQEKEHYSRRLVRPGLPLPPSRKEQPGTRPPSPKLQYCWALVRPKALFSPWIPSPAWSLREGTAPKMTGF